MKTVFADTSYWIALTDPGDAWHAAAIQAEKDLGAARVVTTDEVLGEFLTGLSRFGPRMRGRAANAVRRMLTNTNVHVVPQTRRSFLEGLELYRSRPDKAYSLPDCISMCLMKKREVGEVLTCDRDFEREGFRILMPRKVPPS